MQAIKFNIRPENYGSIVQLAEKICDWAVKMPKYFTEGSKGKPSKASPSIPINFRG